MFHQDSLHLANNVYICGFPTFLIFFLEQYNIILLDQEIRKHQNPIHPHHSLKKSTTFLLSHSTMPHSKTMILTTAFIAITALALPDPTHSLRRRDFPQPIGQDQGKPFDKLELTVYAEQNCQGTPAGIFDGSYGFYAARQMQSYRLNRTLVHGYEQLDFYAGPLLPGYLDLNHTVDMARNGHYTTSCLEHDTVADFIGERAGCHTLEVNQWCAVISISDKP